MGNAMLIKFLAFTSMMHFHSVATSTKSTDLTLIGTVSKESFSAGIFRGTYSWFQASSYCRQAGYDTLVNSLPGWGRSQALVQFLRETNYVSPATFWTVYVRPYPYVTRWYNGKNCKIRREINRKLDNSASDGQCIVMIFQNTSGFNDPLLQAKDCTHKYSFICYSNHGHKEFQRYQGYSIRNSAPPFVSSVRLNIQDDVECEQKCRSSGHCAVYTYMESKNSCIVQLPPDGYGKVEYNLTFTGDNVTLGAKIGKNTITTGTLNTDTLMEDFDTTLPTCNLPLIPNDYCKCGVPREEFEVLIKEMETDPKATAKRKRKYKSAEDDRASSKTLGTLGVVIIATAIGVIILADVGTLLMKLESKLNTKAKQKSTTV